MRLILASMFCCGLLAADAPAAAPTAAPAAPARPWSNVSTLSFVATNGNAVGQTLGFANDYGYKWALTSLSLKTSAVRASNTLVNRTATGTTLDNAVVAEQKITTTTAEMFGASARLDHRLKDKDRFYGFMGAGWERNRPAGLDSRTTAVAGVGRIWADSDRTKFRTDLGIGWAHENPVVPPPGFKHNYGTWSLNSQFKQKVGASSLYGLDLSVTDSLSNSRDWQGFLKQGLQVTINSKFALKVGYDLFYRNLPNLIGVTVFDTSVDPAVSIGKISIPAKKLDTVFTTSLVVTF